MKIGLIDIEPKIFNTAYMQIAAYYKERGDSVEWWSPLTDGEFDYVYCSSLFDYTDKTEVPERAITGGTGYAITSRLSRTIEESGYDYGLYPKCKCSFVWFSRGCLRKCPWCVVPEKEGTIHSVEPKPFNPDKKYVVVQDNNFFANPNWRSAVDLLDCWAQPVDIQGVDARLLNEEQCRALNRLTHYKRIKIAWDNPKENLVPKFTGILRHIKAYKLICYVLIGFASTREQDLWRVETLRNLGIDPFVMPYNRKDPYQKAFARWVNHKAIFKTVRWEDYRAGKL